MELTTPEKFTMAVIVKPEELFSYDTTVSKYFQTRVRILSCGIDGEYQLCIQVSEAVFLDPSSAIKSVKTKLFFSNEYYSGKSRSPESNIIFGK